MWAYLMKSFVLAALAVVCSWWMSVESRAAAPDWLLDATPYKARVVQSGAEVTLDNGLIRRTIRTKNGCATVSFENRMTGEQMIRAIRPEAVVELDGVKYPVGGLTGQPIQNYLSPAWLATMTPLPSSFVLDSLEIGKTKARFEWMKRKEWMPVDMPWPPAGASLTLRFRAPDEGLGGDTRERKALLADDFLKFDEQWKPSYSKAHDRTSFQNEGKTGEIYALANSFAFVERELPAGTQVVQCKIDPGTDRGASWGPGIVLVYPDRNVKFNLRIDHQTFGIGDAAAGKLEPSKPYTLRMTIASGNVLCEASLDGKTFERVGNVSVRGEPRAVRLGKTDPSGNANDYGSKDLGELGRCRYQDFQILGEPLDTAAKVDSNVWVDVHYEIYDGIPLLSKWIVVRNTSAVNVQLNTFVAETLSLTEAESSVEPNPRWELPGLHVETDYAFLSMSIKGANAAVKLGSDPTYETQVNYDKKTPCLLECTPPVGPDQLLAPGATLESFRVFELAYDSTERERNSLALRRMYRTIAPWVTENPILMHVRSASPEAVRLAIDQCHEVGFEMVIMTFGSGFNYESRDPAYQQAIKELVDYAKYKGVALGGYSLLASRGAATGADNTQGVPARYGVMPCLGATWGTEYLAQLKRFMSTAGLSVLEHDGSYPGDRCAATNHPGHRGLGDSQWAQWRAITDLYKSCRATGVYLNIPDWYFLTGGNKTGMGYRETNWSLPREYQEIIERQNVFDGTWEKTPSMGWMMVPLTEYHGGGAAATIEPLKDHLPHYDNRMANLFGAGVQACYRGPRLYDTDGTKLQVKKWVDFYKQHRPILDSDILHLRRADGRDLDYILHVNPTLKEKGLLMVYNPLPESVTKTLTIPLYYTGLTDVAKVQGPAGAAQEYRLNRKFEIELPVTIPAHGYSWFVVE